MKKHKLQLVMLCCCAGLLVALATTLCLRRTVFKVSDLAGTVPAADTNNEAKEGLTEAGDSAPTSNGGATGTAAVEGSGRSISIGTLTPDFSPEVPSGQTDGTVAVHVIKTLPENALDWSKPMQEPQVGDVVEIEVPPARKYEFRVTSVDIYDEPRKVVILGSLPDNKGTAALMLLNGRMLLQIKDNSIPAVYNLYFDNKNEQYIVQEINPDKGVQPQPDKFPARHEQEPKKVTLPKLPSGNPQ